MKKVLIIVYYWPPSGGAGVQRWLKMSRYLVRQGYDVTIYTPSNPDFALKDTSLLKKIDPKIKVLKRRIFEPYGFYKFFLGKKGRKNVNSTLSFGENDRSLLKRIAYWIRGNFFIPDPRVFWVKPSVRFLLRCFKHDPFDVVITTGPPHSMHLIGLGLKKKLRTDITWIADFRDPWTEIDFYDKLNLTKRADRKHHRLERMVVEQSDKVVVVSEAWAEQYRNMREEQVHVITNGYDPEDFQGLSDNKNPVFTISHIGSVNRDRNPDSLWAAISEFIEEKSLDPQHFRIKLIGDIDTSVRKSLKQYNLEGFTETVNFLPHKQALQEMRSSQVLLLLLNDTPNVKGVVPGKLFEYIGTGNPILCIGDPSGDAAQIIRLDNLGHISDFRDRDSMKSALIQLHRDWKNEEGKRANERYSVANLSKQYAGLF